MKKEPFFDFLDEINQFTSHGKEDELEISQSEQNIVPNERTAFLLFPFFVQLIDQFKDTLKNLRNQTRIHKEKFRDQEFGEHLDRIIMGDIRKIELLQNNLLNYIRINNPLIKTDTVNTIIDEELKKYQVELEEKKIKLFKTLEKNLPETAVPDDQLRYILTCLLQYVIASLLPNVSLGLFTKSLVIQRERGVDQAPAQREEKYVEILMAFTSPQTPMDQFEPALGSPGRQKEGILNLTLRLLDEMVQKNRGVMTFREDEKKKRTIISLRFPMERRKVIYYPREKESSPGVSQSKTTFEKLSSLEEMKKWD
ncbi:MAG: hypothetical protein ACXU9W_06995 [Thermodesulfobacteriota bacterium]